MTRLRMITNSLFFRMLLKPLLAVLFIFFCCILCLAYALVNTVTLAAPLELKSLVYKTSIEEVHHFYLRKYFRKYFYGHTYYEVKHWARYNGGAYSDSQLKLNDVPEIVDIYIENDKFFVVLPANTTIVEKNINIEPERIHYSADRVLYQYPIAIEFKKEWKQGK